MRTNPSGHLSGDRVSYSQAPALVASHKPTETGSIFFSIITQFDTTYIRKKQMYTCSKYFFGEKIWENKHIYPTCKTHQPLILLIEMIHSFNISIKKNILRQ